MREEARELRRPAASPIDLDAEQEVDLGRYAATVAARWWLPLLGLTAGVAIGYAVALGGSASFRAQALVDLGNPLGPGGGSVQSVQALVARARELATADATVNAAAARAGIPRAQLRSRLDVKTVSANPARTPTAPLLSIAVTGSRPRRVARAANGVAREVVDDMSRYVNVKIADLREQIAADRRQLATIDREIAGVTRAAGRQGVGTAEGLLLLTLETRAASVREDLSERTLSLALAEEVERANVLKSAVPVKISARNARTSAIVGGVIGLLLGLLAALAWDPLASAFARRRD